MSAKEQADKIKSGEMQISALTKAFFAGKVDKATLSEDTKRLKEIDEQVQLLMKDEKVVEGYKSLKKKRDLTL